MNQIIAICVQEKHSFLRKRKRQHEDETLVDVQADRLVIFRSLDVTRHAYRWLGTPLFDMPSAGQLTLIFELTAFGLVAAIGISAVVEAWMRMLRQHR